MMLLQGLTDSFISLLSALLPWQGLLGVIVGWTLNQATVKLKDKRRVAKLQGMLGGELHSLACQLPDKRDIIRQMIEALDAGRLLPGDSVHALRLVYEHHGGELFAHLDDIHRNCLHVIYEKLRVLDLHLDGFHKNFQEAVKSDIHPDTAAAFKQMLHDLDNECATVGRLIQSYLEGKPVDVFHTRSNPQER